MMRHSHRLPGFLIAITAVMAFTGFAIARQASTGDSVGVSGGAAATAISSATGTPPNLSPAGSSSITPANPSGNIGATVESPKPITPGENTTPGVNAPAVPAGNDTVWDAQSMYWRNNYPTRPYYSPMRDYASYEPAYHYGVELYAKHAGKPYTELSQPALAADWQNVRGTSPLAWPDAQAATRDAYTRLYNEGKAGAAASRR